MDSRQFYSSIPGEETSRDLSYLLASPIKSISGPSTNSILSGQVNGDTLSAVSNNSLEQHSSTETHSGKCPSGDSSGCSYVPFCVDVHRSCQASQLRVPEMHALQEIETLLMAPDTDEEAITSSYTDLDYRNQAECVKLRSRSSTPDSHQEYSLNQYNNFLRNKYQKLSHGPQQDKQLSLPKQISQIDVKGLLIECANALSDNRLADFEMLLEKTCGLVSISGDPVQRLGAYMREGLVARQEASGTAIYRALRCQEPEGRELLSHMQIMYGICPYFKFGYMAANGAIAEAIKNEERVHIIDFQIAQGTQWFTLIEALAARPSGPPHLRITGVDDAVNRYARGDNLEAVGLRLKKIAEKFNIPLEFNGLSVFATEVTRDMLAIRPGETVVVNFTLQLHHTPDESVDVSNPRDGLLRMVKGLSPKVTTLVEQESNTNTTPFVTRFMETWDYYSAMFESIDVTLPRNNKDRINVEQNCLAKDIVNIIACEGKDRLERHELLGKWRSRFTMAGFKPSPLSTYVNSVIKSLLSYYSDKYTLVEKDEALLLGWKGRNLISASAWH